ncbi:MAG TPA: MFS transporter [Acidimicrobiales bacterium]|nr:MFS transporter [Acidimicrobiales bacterium]
MFALVQFMFLLDSTIVNPALPTIQKDLHFSTSGLAWVVNGYTLMAGGFLILGGRVADLFGRKRMFIAGVIVFAVGSALSGLAQNSTMLVSARFVQGLGEAIAAPAALSIVVLNFTDAKERAKAIGIWGGIAGLGATLGVVISGFVVDWLNWRWIFLVNLPVALVVLFVLPRMVKESRLTGDRRVDYLGAVLITAGLTLMVEGLLQASTHSWSARAVLVPLLIGAGLVIAFIVTQIVKSNTLVPKRFFRNRTRVSANLVTLAATASFFALFFSLTLYMQDVLHYSAIKTGLAWGPFGVMLLIGFGVSANLLPRLGVKIGLIVAYSLGALGLFLLSFIGTGSDYPAHILPGMLVMALGQSIVFIGLQNSALYRLGAADAGIGSAVQNTAQQLGGSLGLAVLVTIALRHASSQVVSGVSAVEAATHGYSLAIELAAAVMAVGALAVAITFEKVEFIPPAAMALGAAEAAAGEVQAA